MFPERSRSMDDRVEGQCNSYMIKRVSPYTRTDTPFLGYRLVGTEKVIMDMLSHGFRKNKRRKLLVQHPVDIRTQTGSCTSGVIRTTNPNLNIYGLSGQFATIGPPSVLGAGSTGTAAAFDAQQYDLSLMKANAAFAQPDWDVGVGLAEARQTITFLMSPMKGLLGILSKVEKAGKRKIFPVSNYPDRIGKPTPAVPSNKLSAILSRMSEAWLGLRYGAVPLMLDIDDGRKWFEKSLLAPCRDLSSKRGTINVYDTIKYQKVYTSGWWTITFEDTVQNGTKTTSGIFYFNEMSWVGNRAVQLGLSPTQLLHTLYESFPLSFMLDWSVNLGDWLRTKCPVPGINRVGCFTSVKRYSYLSRRTLAVRHYYSAAQPVVDQDSNLYISLEKLQRQINSPLPEKPRLNIDRLVMNLSRELDTASLLWQTRPKFLRK